jgi:hypothetical protein
MICVIHAVEDKGFLLYTVFKRGEGEKCCYIMEAM